MLRGAYEYGVGVGVPVMNYYFYRVLRMNLQLFERVVVLMVDVMWAETTAARKIWK